MYNEYMQYHADIRECNKRGLVMFLWSPLLPVVLAFTIAATLAALPMGIIFGIGSFFFLRFYIKKCIRYAEAAKKLREYRKTHKLSNDIKQDTTYCFVIPSSTQEALNTICDVLTSVGEVKSIDPHHGVLKGRIRVSVKKTRPVTFYVERNNEQCKVRACFRRKANDDWWDLFLDILFERNPGVDFGVSLAKGDPVVAGVLDLSGDTREVYSSTTSGGTSLGGFLLGGALFGDAGAVVGGLSGKQHTVTNSHTVFSHTLLVRVIYSNGRLWEGTVNKGSQLYNEIMVLS